MSNWKAGSYRASLKRTAFAVLHMINPAGTVESQLAGEVSVLSQHAAGRAILELKPVTTHHADIDQHYKHFIA